MDEKYFVQSVLILSIVGAASLFFHFCGTNIDSAIPACKQRLAPYDLLASVRTLRGKVYSKPFPLQRPRNSSSWRTLPRLLQKPYFETYYVGKQNAALGWKHQMSRLRPTFLKFALTKYTA